MNEIYRDFGEAFLAPKAKSLYDLIVIQGEKLLGELGADTPSSCVSVVLLLAQHRALSTAQISQKLEKSHQLISTRISKLEKLGIVEKQKNNADKRANKVTLTPQGLTELTKIEAACAIADRHFRDLYSELGFDVGNILEKMELKLKLTPLKSNEDSTSPRY
ncbi:MarR family transcriptional regulator [Alteromonas sediminis]|uniref:MarR family transcriptional regulator n=1 Tax=Alteromonas sediminis TaxID=2259342 RepID=A0A3N5Z6V5_9ALTE|nr:MarR family transcriptional regulator [Alteromonas sediminis]RPJ66364.1 MarR family transcriptional regulator [Alteromonas sediminis]